MTWYGYGMTRWCVVGTCQTSVCRAVCTLSIVNITFITWSIVSLLNLFFGLFMFFICFYYMTTIVALMVLLWGHPKCQHFHECTTHTFRPVKSTFFPYTFNFLVWFLLFSWGFLASRNVGVYSFWGEGVSESVWFVYSWKCWDLWMTPLHDYNPSFNGCNPSFNGSPCYTSGYYNYKSV